MLAEICKHTILIPQPYIGLSKVILKNTPVAPQIMTPTQGLEIWQGVLAIGEYPIHKTPCNW
jgi:hypothetical protein